MIFPFHKFESVPLILVLDFAVDRCVVDKLKPYLFSISNALFVTCSVNDLIY